MELKLKNSDLVAVIDDDQKNRLLGLNWYLHKGYAVTNISNKSAVALHLIVNGWPPEGLVTDHIDRDKMNNRKENLRFVTPAQNLQNKQNVNQGSSQYLGVLWDKSRNCWRARIKKDNKTYCLGRYTHEVDAAKAYNRKAIELYAERATLNSV